MASETKHWACVVLLTIANLLVPASIVAFGIGFFPHKPFLPGLAEHDDATFGDPPPAPFDKVVFMVVDALRSDFVFSNSSGFKFTQSLIRDGTAMPFTAHARSPTVTMPRLKAITTGSIPSFVDLILNFDEGDTSSTLAAQDTWLAQMRSAEKGKLLMFGDDTWLKLFPKTFDRHDGTSSFFVSDFTEVDNNVTRNVAPELENQDWGLMVLHYLGLDHIGHKSGPRSGNMVPKQREMDGIVRMIYHAIETKDHLKSTLFVLCGDHGMNDAGNHGASSPGETSPALLFMSPKLKGMLPKLEAPAEPDNEFHYYRMVEQSDITPTMAAMLGFPVSKNNLGAFLTDFLPLWPVPRHQTQILVQNARQILRVIAAAFGGELFAPNNESNACTLEATLLNTLACQWQQLREKADVLLGSSDSDQDWIDSMSSWLRQAQELMSSMASNYDLSKLALGQIIATAAVICSVAGLLQINQHRRRNILPLSLISISYGAMMFASSYVEEEQHFWYWSSTFWIAHLGLKAMRRARRKASGVRYLAALCIIRLVRSWNQTGQKFAAEPDIVQLFITPHPQVLWCLIILSYVLISLRLLASFQRIPPIVATSITSIIASSALAFKLAFTAQDAPELVVGLAKNINDVLHGQSLLSRARVVFIGLSAVGCLAVHQARSGGTKALSSAKMTLHAYSILAMTQSRATNVPLVLLSTMLFHCLDPAKLTVMEISTTSLLLQYTSFFAFGGSNAISSVDLSNAYNGIGGFNIVAVGILTFISNWAGPIFWVFATNVLLLQKHRQGQPDVLPRHLSCLTLFSATSVAFVMAACTALRAHLFIWTVFSPKYLYCMAWSLAQHLAVNIVLGSLLFRLAAD